MTRWLIFILLVVSATGIAHETVWVTGMYWLFHGSIFRSVSGRSVLWDTIEVTFIAIKGTELMGIETWVIAVINQAGRMPLFLLPYMRGIKPYMRWPLPLEFMIATGAPRSPTVMTTAALGLPTYGTTAFLASQDHVGEIEIEITCEGLNSVTTLAGSFEQSFVVRYKNNVAGQHKQGRAWWAPQVGWWVRVEGNASNERGEVVEYTIELRRWGVFTFEEIAFHFDTALKFTANYSPELAEEMRKILQNLGIMVPSP